MENKIIFVILVICSLLALTAGCTVQNQGSGLMTMDVKTAQSGDKVSVHYIGRLTDGTVFDSSVGKAPLDFVIDDGGMIKGFNDAVKGMKESETKSVTLPPSEAYGVSDPKKIVTFDSNVFDFFDSMQVGMVVVAQNGMRGTILEKNDNNAVIDFNPELAGKTLIFEITLVSIE